MDAHEQSRLRLTNQERKCTNELLMNCNCDSAAHKKTRCLLLVHSLQPPSGRPMEIAQSGKASLRSITETIGGVHALEAQRALSAISKFWPCGIEKKPAAKAFSSCTAVKQHNCRGVFIAAGAGSLAIPREGSMKPNKKSPPRWEEKCSPG